MQRDEQKPLARTQCSRALRQSFAQQEHQSGDPGSPNESAQARQTAGIGSSIGGSGTLIEGVGAFVKSNEDVDGDED